MNLRLSRYFHWPNIRMTFLFSSEQNDLSRSNYTCELSLSVQLHPHLNSMSIDKWAAIEFGCTTIVRSAHSGQFHANTFPIRKMVCTKEKFDQSTFFKLESYLPKMFDMGFSLTGNVQWKISTMKYYSNFRVWMCAILIVLLHFVVCTMH